MQANRGAALLTLALWALCSPGLSTEGKRKLQIGVKKRVDNCPIKSRKGDVLHMHYTIYSPPIGVILDDLIQQGVGVTGKLEDGTEFDSSLTRDQPFIFSLGTGQVIKGWEQGLLGMCEGEKRKLVIPSELGYGDRGAPPKIPGGATLIFEVELLKIERRQEL
ncbi:Peptidyl-prolyl cis-trans isomerase FKBP2 [Ophiophagus hannah]|uniref:peptidylprolyl isomerase n=2 Tax=Elapidae TaxID=8602 RepID=V8N5V3_OPHHA|nr:Peptidyl-prolyl cis-trans isomerase FKBP2 [Ophiophagus hannah]